MAARLGDRSRAETLERHNALVRRGTSPLPGPGGHTTGDGFLAIFGGPARAVRCALETARAARSLGLEIQAVPLPVNVNWPGRKTSEA